MGGSKTLLAAFDDSGQIAHETKIKTASDYQQFLVDLDSIHKQEFGSFNFRGCGLATTGILDRQTGIVKVFGNLDWTNIPIRDGISKTLGLSVVAENDANLGGLSEAVLVREKYKRVLYITLSRGIGGKLIIDGKISREIPDAEVGFMVFEHKGKLTEWEEFASGDALTRDYGKLASELDDQEAWDDYSYRVAVGLQPLLSVWQPDVVIIGGGVGAHFEKFQPQLMVQLGKFKSHMVTVPPIIKARRPEEAVIYGCYELAKQNFA